MSTFTGWIVGRDLSDTFEVQVPANSSVFALKKAIKETCKPTFDSMDTSLMQLWSVSLPIDEEGNFDAPKAREVTRTTKRLGGSKSLTQVRDFAVPAGGYLHVVVAAPEGIYV